MLRRPSRRIAVASRRVYAPPPTTALVSRRQRDRTIARATERSSGLDAIGTEHHDSLPTASDHSVPAVRTIGLRGKESREVHDRDDRFG